MIRRSHEEVEKEKEVVFKLIQEGYTYPQIADKLGITAELIAAEMKRYEPYQVILRERQRKRDEEMKRNRKLIVEYHNEGLSKYRIAEKLRISYQLVGKILRQEGFGEEKRQVAPYAKSAPVFVLTTDDVSVFKQITRVGDSVRTNFEGSRGIVVSKEKWYAKVESADLEESYGIPWNWLCCCNRERIGK